MTQPGLPPLSPAPATSTSFIDVTAKLSLLLGVLSVLWSVFQLLLAALLRRFDLSAWMQQQEIPFPAALHWAAQHALSLSFLLLGASLAFVAVSWGLLRRREWGRTGFIIFLVLVALANFAFLPLIQELFNGLYTIVPAEFLDSPQGHEMRAQLRFSQWSALLTAGISAVAFAILHGWLVVKLQRPEIRRQFR